MVPPSTQRSFVDRGHFAPESGVDRTGQPWRGTSRIIDRQARRKANARSWKRFKDRARRAHVATLVPPVDGPPAAVDDVRPDGVSGTVPAGRALGGES